MTEMQHQQTNQLNKQVEPTQARRRSGMVLQDNRDLRAPLQRNNTGLPDNLKSGMENVSGMNLDNVRVHYNSSQPETVQAHAFAQGTDIHLASGQEQHLPHELGHVVQQAQGRVQANTSVNGMAVNDNRGLESEATQMGEAALSAGSQSSQLQAKPPVQMLAQKGVAQRAIAVEELDVNYNAETSDADIQEFVDFLVDDDHELEAMGAEFLFREIRAMANAGEHNFERQFNLLDALRALQQGNDGDEEDDNEADIDADVEEQEEVADEPEQDVIRIGRRDFDRGDWHHTVKPRIIAAITTRALSLLVYHDTRHHNFDFWIANDGTIWAGGNNTGGHERETDYRLTAQDAVVEA